MTGAHFFPDTETLFHIVKGAKSFAKVDLSSAYYQIELVDEAQKLVALKTNQGQYRVKRLTKGMGNVSVIFQERNEKALIGLTEIIIFKSDVLVLGNNDSHDRKHKLALRDVLKDKISTINETKLDTVTNQISFPGYINSAKSKQPEDRNNSKY